MLRRETHEERRERLTDGARRQATDEVLRSLVEAERLDDDDSYAIAMLLVDSVLDGDETSLRAALRQLQLLYRVFALSTDATSPNAGELRGRVLAFLDVAAWGLERSPSQEVLVEFERDSNGHQFLRAITERPGLTNSEISDELGVSNSEVSRLGRRLADAGIAAKRRLGRRNHWEVTPKGLQALELLEAGGAARLRRPKFEFHS